jgi:hypothetical protein
MKIKSKISIVVFGLFFLSTVYGEDPLEYWLADNAPFWSWNGTEFIENAVPVGFGWTVTNQSARAAPLKVPLFGTDAYEAVVRFKDGSPASFMASYYNRGDSEEKLSERKFQNQVRDLIQSISSTLRVQPRPGNNASSRTGIREDSRIWQRPKIQFELAYSYTSSGSGGGFRAEYIRLVAKEFTSSEIPSHARDRVNPYEVRKNVTREPTTGDVWIANIPMVDQGPKGYCAAATSERILRFFGQEVDQHQVAQIANTTSKGGTSSNELKTALQAVGRQYGFTFNTIQDWDFEDFREEMEDYNDLAWKRGTRNVSLPHGGTWYIADLYQSVDPDTWKELKTKQRSDFRKFEERIRKYVNGGCPLAWSVTLGMFPEEGVNGSGGHLRLIIGYNTRTKEILYSDTWGFGHEKKRMPLDQAFAITKSLFTLEPKGLRL